MRKLLVIFAILFYVYSSCVFAATGGNVHSNASEAFAYLADTVTDIVNTVSTASSSFALTLLSALSVITLVLSLGKVALSRHVSLGYITDTLVRVMLTVGFVLFLVQGMQSVVIEGFRETASFAGSVSGQNIHNPSDVVDTGVENSFEIIRAGFGMLSYAVGGETSVQTKYPINTNLGKTAALINFFCSNFLGIFLMAVFLACGVNLLMIYIAFVFHCGIAMFLLGFMGSSMTKDLGRNWISCCLGLAVNYYGTLLLAVVCGMMTNHIFMDFASAGGPNSPQTLSALFVTGIATLMLLNTVPRALTSLISAPAAMISGLDAKLLFGMLLGAGILFFTKSLNTSSFAGGVINSAGKTLANSKVAGKVKEQGATTIRKIKSVFRR